jgi:hypothetical protein
MAEWPACHAGGRGFEFRRSRHDFKRLHSGIIHVQASALVIGFLSLAQTQTGSRLLTVPRDAVDDRLSKDRLRRLGFANYSSAIASLRPRQTDHRVIAARGLERLVKRGENVFFAEGRSDTVSLHVGA